MLFCVWSVVEEVAMGQDLLWVFRLGYVCHIPPMLHTHLQISFTLGRTKGRNMIL
jgi:hypothetical protein